MIPKSARPYAIATISASDAPAGEGLGDRRDVGDGALRGIRLVLADDAEGLAAAVLALDRDRRAEMRLRGVGRRGHDLRRVAPRRPVAEITGGAGEARLVVGLLRGRVLAMQPLELGLDAGEAFRSDEIRMRRDRAVGQILECLAPFRLLDERAAHELANPAIRSGSASDAPVSSIICSREQSGAGSDRRRV